MDESLLTDGITAGHVTRIHPYMLLMLAAWGGVIRPQTSGASLFVECIDSSFGLIDNPHILAPSTCIGKQLPLECTWLCLMTLGQCFRL